MSKNFQLTLEDGSKKHIKRRERDSLLGANHIQFIGFREGRPLYVATNFIPKLSGAIIGPANVSHPQCRSDYQTRLRERRLALADGFHTPDQWIARVNFYGWCCAYCGIGLNFATLTKDHKIPISSGGSEWPSNLVPCCKSCNSWKSDRRVRPIVS